MKNLSIERLHEVHHRKYEDEFIPKGMGQTELMVQNVCSTVEVNKDQEPYLIGITTRSYRNWLDNILPRIAMELNEREIEFDIRQGEIKVFNAIICLYGERPYHRGHAMEFNDNY